MFSGQRAAIKESLNNLFFGLIPFKAVILLFCLIFFGHFFSLKLFAQPQVSEVRLGLNGDITRFVIELTNKVSFNNILLADPYRVVLDLDEVEFKLSQSGSGEGRGVVNKYRYGLFREGVSRLVLDLNSPAIVSKIFLIKPDANKKYRLVLDLKPTTRATFLNAVDNNKIMTPKMPSSAKKFIRDTPKHGKKVIVIDAGHGGIDPGNLGIIGVPEKVVALKIAQALRSELKKNPNYEVHLTREKDIFIPLRGRVNIARKQVADLFISVHADSFRESRVRGATIYTLSEKSSDREADRLARKENRSDAVAGVNLEEESDVVASILIDLAQRETMNLSSDLANKLVDELKGDIILRTNSHRYAGLMVLKAVDIPSILLETGYLTNKQDANNLINPAWQKKFAYEIKKGVDKFFSSLGG